MNPKVDFYFNKAKKWHDELHKLRTIVLSCGLNEELKWGQPCYTKDKKNIVLIHDFKEYCAVLFFKGTLVHDPHGLLLIQTENVQSGRQARFTSVHEVEEKSSILKDCIHDAIEVEKKGLKVDMKKTEDFPVPSELKYKLDHIPDFKKAFEALTPGRQRGYLLFFAAPKQSKTREARVEKYMPQIMNGKGLNDE